MNTTTIRRAACALMLAGTLALLTGCVSQMTERPAQDISAMDIPIDAQAPEADAFAAREETFALYYLSEDGARLRPVVRTVTVEDGMSRSEAALRALMDGPQEGEDGVSWPEIGRLTGVRSYALSCGVATVELPARARALTPAQLYAVRMAVACTLTEFQEVSYVNVLVGGREEGLDLAGTLAVGALSRAEDLDVASRFARLDEQRQSASGGITRDTTLWFPSQDGQWIVPQVRSVSYSSASAIDYLYTLLEELGAGTDHPMAAGLPAPMQYIGEMPEIVRTEDGATLAVELQFDTSLDAALAEAGLTRGVYLAALTDTLMGFIPGIDGLRVRIGGEAVEALDAQQTPRGEALLFAEGMMTRADFAGYAGAPCTLYLPAEGGICEVSCVVDQQRANSPRERLGQLMRMGALPRGLTDADVLAVAVEPERVLVNLSGAFAEALSGLSAQEERAAVYAMVNTLTEFAGTDGTPQRVAFFFDGAQRESPAGGIEMRGELMRNPGMVVD